MNLKKYAPIIVGSIAGAAIGFFATTSVMKFLEPILDRVSASWLFLFLPLSGFLAVLLHEGGHVLAGLSAGFRFHMMSVLFLKLEKTGDKFAVRWNSQLNSWGGLAVLFPESQTNRTSYAWFVAGGPLASLFVTGLTFTIFLNTYQTAPVIGLFSACLMLLNGAISLVTMIPFPIDVNFDTDGKQFLDLLRGGDYAERKLATAHILTESTGGKLPLDLSEKWIDIMEKGGKIDVTTLVAWMFRTSMEMDRDEWEKAAERMNLMFEHESVVPPIMNRSLYLQMSIIEAFRNKPTEATYWLNKAGPKGYAEASWVSLAQAAEAHVHGRIEEARKFAQEGLAKINETMDPGSAKMTERLLSLFIEHR